MKKIKSFIFLLFNIALICGCSNSSQSNNYDGMAYIKYVSDIAVPFENVRPVPIGYKLQFIDLPELTAPTYHFKGWYDGFNKIEVGTRVSEDMTLRAKWIDPADTVAPINVFNIKTEEKNTVTNNVDGSVTDNTKLILSWTNPTDDDYYGVELSINDHGKKSKVILDKDSTSFVLREKETTHDPDGFGSIEVIIGDYCYIDFRTFDINNNFSEILRYAAIGDCPLIDMNLSIDINKTGKSEINLNENSNVSIRIYTKSSHELILSDYYSIDEPINIKLSAMYYEVELTISDSTKTYTVSKDADLTQEEKIISFDI